MCPSQILPVLVGVEAGVYKEYYKVNDRNTPPYFK